VNRYRRGLGCEKKGSKQPLKIQATGGCNDFKNCDNILRDDALFGIFAFRQ
jgi:hypothetical protein